MRKVYSPAKPHQSEFLPPWAREPAGPCKAQLRRWMTGLTRSCGLAPPRTGNGPQLPASRAGGWAAQLVCGETRPFAIWREGRAEVVPFPEGAWLGSHSLPVAQSVSQQTRFPLRLQELSAGPWGNSSESERAPHLKGSKSAGRTMWEQHVKWRGCGSQSRYLAPSDRSWRAAWRWKTMTDWSPNAARRGAGTPWAGA